MREQQLINSIDAKRAARAPLVGEAEVAAYADRVARTISIIDACLELQGTRPTLGVWLTLRNLRYRLSRTMPPIEGGPRESTTFVAADVRRAQAERIDGASPPGLGALLAALLALQAELS